MSMNLLPLIKTPPGRVVQAFYLDKSEGAKLVIGSNHPELAAAQIMVEGGKWVCMSTTSSNSYPVSDANYPDIAQFIIDTVALYAQGKISYFGSVGTSGIPPRHMSAHFGFGKSSCGFNLLILIGSVILVTLLLIYANGQLSNRF